MKRILSAFFFIASLLPAKAQNSFSFSCSRDTTLDCTQNCITLKAIIPNVKASTTSYVVNPMTGPGGCFRPYVDPGLPGTATNLSMDDTYSNAITLPFNFPFFESVYRKLVISTNGVVSFDSSIENTFAHYAILNSGGSLSSSTGTGQNLPSPLFDKALIMSPYHDIDLTAGTSPTQRVKYEIVGAAPHRKWILSFYKIPLFQATCNNLIQNTHQIVLYEGLGIVEVFVFSKQICTAWNDGRAMIGMQNFARNSGIMAPGRKASDPRWGTVDMDEAWRFTPAKGQPLFKRVELFDLSGNLISTGDTTNIGNGEFQVSFPNVCTNASTTLIVKSTYKKFDNPLIEEYGTDTVNIIRTTSVPPITFTTTNATCASGSNGTITVSPVLDSSYKYSVDGINFQVSPIFNLPVGSYTVTAKDTINGCTTSAVLQAVISSVTTLIATGDSINAACAGSSTGKIIVHASLGTAPYTYALDNSTSFQTSDTLQNVVGGTHSVKVKDAGGCVFIFLIKVLNDPGISTTAVSTTAFCPGSPTGIITVNPPGAPNAGLAPYTYAKDNGAFVSNNIFSGLTGDASYNISVKDANGCTFSFVQNVNSGPGITATVTAVNASCNGIANGKIIVNSVTGVAPYTYSVDGGPAQANDTLKYLAVGSHTVTVTDANSCTVTISKVISYSTGSTYQYITQPTTCAGVSDGAIIFRGPFVGSAPFLFSIDSGITFHSADTVRNLPAGNYVIVMKDSTGCIYYRRAVIYAGNGLTATAVAVKSACAGVSTGKIIIRPVTGTRPFRYSIDGGTTFYTGSDTIPGLSSGTYSVLITDANGCNKTLTGIVIADSSGVTATYSTIKSACAGVASGQITITPVLGKPPFRYALNAGIPQLSNIFTNVLSGTYSVLVTDSNGCSKTLTGIVVGDSTGVTATASTIKSACAGAATGQIIVTPGLGKPPFKYSLNAGIPQLGNTFINLASNTYSITVTDSNLCFVIISATVLDSTGVTATASTIKSACAGAATGQIIVTPVLGKPPFKYSLNAGIPQFSNTFTNLVSNTYSITITDSNLCSATINATVGDSTGVTATASSIKSACAGAATGQIIVTPGLGKPPFKYALNAGIPQLGNTFTNLASNTYTITVTDSNLCSATINATVGDSTGVTATASSIKSACAAASTGKIIVKTGLGKPPFRFSLDGGATTQTSDTIPGLAANSYTVTVLDSNNCTATLTVIVGDSTGATATARTVKSACSSASTGKIIVVPGIGTSPFRYSLGTGAFQSNDTFPNLAANTYRVNVLDANNCPFSFDTTVVNLPVVPPSVHSLNAACSAAATGTIIITPNAGTGIRPFQYSLDNGVTFPYSDTIRDLSANTYSLAIKDSNNCVINFTGVVINNPGVKISAVIDKASCAIIPNGKITINPTAGIAPFTYALNNGTPRVSNQFPNLFSGSYTITIKDSALCSLDTLIVVGNAARVVLDSVKIIRPSCNGFTNGTISVYPRLGVPPYKYAINSGSYQTSNVFNNLKASAISDTLHIMDNSGCVKDTILIITEPAVLTIRTASIPATCTGNPDGKITVTGNGGTTPYLYTMDAAMASNFKATPDFYLVNGSYVFGIKDAKGCIVAKADSVILLDTMRLELGRDTTLCVESSILLMPQTNAQTTIFNWSPKAGLSDSLVKNPSASPTDTTKYYLTAKWGICERKDSITINILLKPIAYAGNDTAVCYNTAGSLYGSAGKVSGLVTYLWTPATFLSRTDTTFTDVNADTSGIYPYILTVKDQYGCNFSTTDLVVFTMLPIPVAFAGNDTTAVLGVPHQLLATGGATYDWQLYPPYPSTATLNYTNIANPLATINKTSTFVVTVRNIAGCPATDTIIVTPYVGPTCYLPTAFAPDGNVDVNRVFKPTQVGMKSLDHFAVYNRYGQVVFETSDWGNGWNGTFKGQRQNPGAYIWVIKCIGGNGRAYDFKGTVMLVR